MKFVLVVVWFLGGPQVEYGEYASYQACTTTAEQLAVRRFWCVGKDWRAD